ncbi:hypothetical protein BC829DRAFT_421241 [Chytridium lagenaria]|nr:hypothetical protein BC829DRAFT_421241 [Chytridium lagenaria]
MGETDNHQDFKDDVDSKKRPHAAEPTQNVRATKIPFNVSEVNVCLVFSWGPYPNSRKTSTKKTEAELRREQLEQRLAEKLRKEHEKLEEEVTREKERNRMRMLAQKEEEAKIRNAYTIKHGKNYIAQTETEGDDMDTAPFSLSAGDGVRLDAELGGDDELEDVVGEAF